MPRSSKPILGRAMAILTLPLTPISKARGPIARNLLLFKKRAAASRRRLRHYNYAYVGEYQFSPSSSPLVAHPPGVSSWRKVAKKRRSRARMILASLFCGGHEIDVAVLDGLLPPQPAAVEARDVEALEWATDDDVYGDEDEVQEYDEMEGDEEVDGRAERFIERFYEEMRLQMQRSLVQRLL